ncbi:MAG: ECF-type sigma factor [Pseudomonadota bacterium]
MSEDSPPQQTSTGDVTFMLEQARQGGEEALGVLVARVYSELRQVASNMMQQESSDSTLTVTDLVHEAFLRLFRGQALDWENRRHFFASAAIAMRRVLVDESRRKRADKRIPKQQTVQLDLAENLAMETDVDLVELDNALDALERQSERQARIVELRFFAGLTESEIAEILDVSRMTVGREWRVARLRLLQELDRG